jgi:hypothetical protein
MLPQEAEGTQEGTRRVAVAAETTARMSTYPGSLMRGLFKYLTIVPYRSRSCCLSCSVMAACCSTNRIHAVNVRVPLRCLISMGTSLGCGNRLSKSGGDSYKSRTLFKTASLTRCRFSSTVLFLSPQSPNFVVSHLPEPRLQGARAPGKTAIQRNFMDCREPRMQSGILLINRLHPVPNMFPHELCLFSERDSM